MPLAGTGGIKGEPPPGDKDGGDAAPLGCAVAGGDGSWAAAGRGGLDQGNGRAIPLGEVWLLTRPGAIAGEGNVGEGKLSPSSDKAVGELM